MTCRCYSQVEPLCTSTLMDQFLQKQAKHTVRTVCENYRLPYISLSPINAFNNKHGMVDHDGRRCRLCGSKVELYQRVTGYIEESAIFSTKSKKLVNSEIEAQLVLE